MPLIDIHAGCSTCPLKKDWPSLRNPRMPMALPEEKSSCKILVVGEAPGQTEDKKGVPFTGPTGQYLRDHIPPQWRKKLYWTNCARCHPVDHFDRKDRPPTDQEIKCCSKEFTEKDLDALHPIILAVGGVALSYFWDGEGPNISHVRGIPFPVEFTDGTASWCYPIFHPSFVNRAERINYDDGSVTNSALPVFREDIKNFFNKIPEFTKPPEIIRPPKNVVAFPKTAEETLNLFNQLKEPYALDFETNKMKPYMRDARVLTAGLSDGNITFAFIVNWPGNVNPWGQTVFEKMMRSGKHWIAQNSLYELKWIWHHTNWQPQRFEDTEILARLHHQRTGLGNLEALSRIYLGISIKALTDLNKSRLIDYPPERVREYNGLDAWAEAKVYEKLLPYLDSVQMANYRRSIETVKSVVAMELRGLNVDLKVSEELQKDLYAKANILVKQANELPEVKDYEKKEHKVFSITAPQTVAEVLVNYCKIKLPKTEDGNYTTKEEILEKLVDEHPLVKITLDHREVAKLMSTYIKPILSLNLVGTDGLIHPAYTVVHTATYRLSSYDPNIQNVPRRKHQEIRRQIVAPEGYVLVSFDYAQLEARVIAMASKDVNLTKSIVTKEDIHWKWLYKILDRYPPYMDRLREKSGETEEKKILDGGRTIIKTDFVFASFYGSVAKSIADRTGIPLSIAEEILEQFWVEYKGVKRWIDNQFAMYERFAAVESLTGRIRNEILPGQEISNTPIQGTAAELVLEAQNALFNRAITEDINFLPRYNVHDDVGIIPPERNDDELEVYIKEAANELTLARFPFVSVPLAVECKIGYDWCNMFKVAVFEGKEWDGPVPENIDSLSSRFKIEQVEEKMEMK